MQGSRFLLGSSLVFVRLPEKSFRRVAVSSRLSSSRNYAAKDIELNQSLKDCNVIEESFLTRFMQHVENPACEPDEYGIKYVPVMRQAMCIEGRKVLEAGVDAMDLKNGIYMALEAIKGHLKCRARVASTSEEIAQVERTAGNVVKKTGVLIAKSTENVGKDKEKLKNELKFVKGMKLNWGSVSSFFLNDETQTCVLTNPHVLINESKISKKIVLQAIGPTGYKRPLLIIAEDVEMEVIGSLVQDRTCLSTKFCLVKPPAFEENWKAIMQDLAILTGGWVVTAESNYFLTRLKLGSCKKVIISDNEMVILGGSGSEADIEARCEQLRSAIKSSTSDYEIKLLEERLLKLSHGAVVFKVSGDSKKNKRVVNVLNAANAAMEDGILPGGGIALLHASKELDKLQTTSFGGKIGVQLLQQALKMPVCTIASAAGFEGSVVVEKLLEQDDPDIGYDPARGEYVDVIKLGNVDPLKIIIKELDDVISYFVTHC